MSAQHLNPELFQPAYLDESDKNKIGGRRVGFWQDAFRRFRKNRGAVIGFFLILTIIAFAFIAPLPMMTHYDYLTQHVKIANQAPSWWDGPNSDHYFGTDLFGRDLWVRTWSGTQISLEIALLAAAINLLIGLPYGGIAGYFGGQIDNIMQRFIEIVYSIPNIVVIVLMLLFFQSGAIWDPNNVPTIVPIAAAIAITGWITMARVVRAQMMKLKSQEYVLAARTLGASHARILSKHLIPNVMGPVIVVITFAIPAAIFFEAFLGFIGLGVRPPEASLGVLINAGYEYLLVLPWQLIPPAVVLSLIMLSFNLLGDGLRDALDPKMRK